MKRKHGITLIALVVTIIILLILAAVSIALILGPNGVIKKAKDAKLATRYASLEDQVKVREANIEIANRTGELGKIESIDTFINRLKNQGLLEDDEYDNGTIYLGKKDDGTYEYMFDIAGSVVDLANADEPGNEHLKNMTLIVETKVENTNVILPISDTAGLTINWNAKNSNLFSTPNSSINPSYIYAQAGTYEIQIKGTVQGESALGEKSYCNYIVGIKYWGENGFTAINNFSRKLRGSIPEPSINSFKNVTSFKEAFSQCTELTENIPKNLFINCPKVVSFQSTFDNAICLSGKIPKNLFANCKNVTTFESVFAYCQDLIGNIPENLFKNCSKVKSFESIFEHCEKLSGNIPGNLFSNCPDVEDFSTTFQKCYNLTGKIPENLFKNNKKAKYFLGVFYYCVNLSGDIPSNLFDNCTNVLSLAYLFFACGNLTGEAPDFWNKYPSTYSSFAFTDCIGLSNYEDIPDNWK